MKVSEPWSSECLLKTMMAFKKLEVVLLEVVLKLLETGTRNGNGEGFRCLLKAANVLAFSQIKYR